MSLVPSHQKLLQTKLVPVGTEIVLSGPENDRKHKMIDICLTYCLHFFLHGLESKGTLVLQELAFSTVAVLTRENSST